MVDNSSTCGNTRRMTIREHRKERGLTTRQVATALNVHVRTVERWEHVPLMPQRTMRKRIAALFGVDPSSIDWHIPDDQVAA